MGALLGFTQYFFLVVGGLSMLSLWNSFSGVPVGGHLVEIRELYAALRDACFAPLKSLEHSLFGPTAPAWLHDAVMIYLAIGGASTSSPLMHQDSVPDDFDRAEPLLTDGAAARLALVPINLVAWPLLSFASVANSLWRGGPLHSGVSAPLVAFGYVLASALTFQALSMLPDWLTRRG